LIVTTKSAPRIAILYPGDRQARLTATPQATRFAAIFDAFTCRGATAECAVYHDDFRDEVRTQLLAVDAVLVWVNPIVDGRDRSQLDAMLRDVAATGVYVSTHPDTVLKLGTKQVLFDTRHLPWGTDTHVYRSPAALAKELPLRLAGGVRVLKQYRGHSGDGVWKVQLANAAVPTLAVTHDPLVRVHHARRGSIEEVVPLSMFLQRCEHYFEGEGRMIDQAYQHRLPEGMIRCYLVQNKVEGFGHQAINALCPPPPGMPASEAPLPSTRIYHPPTLPPFQALKRKLEDEWLSQVLQTLELRAADLPVLWDCDFLLGPRDESGNDTYVLCEINVSSVAPFPDSVVEPLVLTTLRSLR
jgi:hypothetical protein